MLHHLAERLESNGIHILVARMKKQFMDTIRATGLIEKMGEQHFFARIQNALDYAWDSMGESPTTAGAVRCAVSRGQVQVRRIRFW